jgi:error-prone DNA polymerase
VAVLPVDVTMSNHASNLEQLNDTAALRLGMHLVSGLDEAAALRIERARAQNPFTSVEDFAIRAALDAPTLNRLAAADALLSLAGHRRIARWQTLGLKHGSALLPPIQGDGISPHLAPLAEGLSIQADYEATGLTLRRHPLAVLRPKLKGHVPATSLANIRNGAHVCTTGLVTCRQRPGTASGVVFVTLEDETGNINVVLWSRLVDRYRKALLGSQLLTVQGKLERKEGMTHVIAERLVDSSRLLGSLSFASHDFH